MTPTHQILVGDYLQLLRGLPDNSVHCCVTSPPYFGLRDYGVEGQIGLEETPAEFIARLVEVFREVRRVLRDDGTCWVNMGDSYASVAGGYAPSGPKGKHDTVSSATRGAVLHGRRRNPPNGLKHKDLMGIPWRLAFALQDDGWYLRQDIIWQKPNPMPESVGDRCTKAHEYLFLLSKSRKYYFDQAAIAEPLAPASVERLAQENWEEQQGRARVPGKSNGTMKAVGGSRRNSFARETKYSAGEHGQKGQHRPDRPDIDYSGKRNKRSVWSVATVGFKGAHFATFPPELIRPCILAGAPRGGLVLDPFGGAATTGLVAMQEGRRSILCELNPEYAAMGQARLDNARAEGGQPDGFVLRLQGISMTTTYGSVCSGIEAASLAWHPLGWRASWFAEVEPFPSAVLAHRWPSVSNLGDMTKLGALVLAGKITAPEVLVGGTPCQAFSVAGMRAGLDDPRGALTIKYVELADAVDHVRSRRGEPETIVVWENVPGVLSDKGNAFGCFLGALAGEDCELQPAGKRWADAGCVFGPKRTIAWRVLDAQYFGLAQRRRRVFVVASARAGFDPAVVLFEREGVRRDTAPRRGEGQDLAGRADDGADLSCGCGYTFPNSLGAYGCPNCEGDEGPAQAIHRVSMAAFNAEGSTGLPFLTCSNIGKTVNNQTPLLALSVHGTQDPDLRYEQAHTLGRNSGQENAVFAIQNATRGKDQNGLGIAADSPMYTLDQASQHAVFAIQAGALRTNPLSGPDGVGVQAEHAYTLEARAEVQAVAIAFQPGNLSRGAGAAPSADIFPTLKADHGRGMSDQDPHVMAGSAVRRLTPRETERLQGFPDDYTLIPWRGKPAEECPDGPRYKAIGNSKAVPVVRWIGRRIQLQLL